MKLERLVIDTDSYMGHKSEAFDITPTPMPGFFSVSTPEAETEIRVTKKLPVFSGDVKAIFIRNLKNARARLEALLGEVEVENWEAVKERLTAKDNEGKYYIESIAPAIVYDTFKGGK